jgi:pyruvate/2-oxoacid:ferredoxin oxidoreductase beta subunit
MDATTRRILGEKKDIMSSGHLACPGCGGALSLRLALKALGRDCAFVIPACCMAVIDGPFPFSSLGVPLYHVAFETAASAASGVRAGFHRQGNDHTTVVAWAGDGGTFDIGLGAVSASAARNDDYLYICYDNEAYMNTGIQQSSATPPGAWTTTTPANRPKVGPKKDIMAILAAHKIPYQATANVAYPDDFLRKFRTAKKTKGFRFIHLYSACPPGHKMNDSFSIKTSRLATQSRVFPLYERRNGGKVVLTENPRKVAVKEYLSPQGRFRHFTEQDIRHMQHEVDRAWKHLLEDAIIEAGGRG